MWQASGVLANTGKVDPKTSTSDTMFSETEYMRKVPNIS